MNTKLTGQLKKAQLVHDFRNPPEVGEDDVTEDEERLFALKPCPFCGGKATIDVQSHYVTISAVHVGDCLMDGEEFGRIKPSEKSIQWMVEAWNRRAE